MVKHQVPLVPLWSPKGRRQGAAFKSGRGRFTRPVYGPFRCSCLSRSPERCSGATGEGPTPGGRSAAGELGANFEFFWDKDGQKRFLRPFQRPFSSVLFSILFWNSLWKRFSKILGRFGSVLGALSRSKSGDFVKDILKKSAFHRKCFQNASEKGLGSVFKRFWLRFGSPVGAMLATRRPKKV